MWRSATATGSRMRATRKSAVCLSYNTCSSQDLPKGYSTGCSKFLVTVLIKLVFWCSHESPVNATNKYLPSLLAGKSSALYKRLQ